MHPQRQNFRNRPVELLLVEDNYGDILLAEEAFKAGAYETHLSVARNGEEALKMLRKEKPYAEMLSPDLVLLDLNLPRKDGREVLKELKSDPATAKIPVVVLTSSRADSDVRKSYELNANCYVVKPVDFEELKRTVASIEAFWFSVALLPTSAQMGSA